MTSAELKKLLAKHGCRFESIKGGSGHMWAIRGNRRTVIPVHGSRKELGKGLVRKILKDLGIKD